MLIDVEKFEENRLRFLSALYEIASDRLTKDDIGGDVTLFSEYESVIGQRAGLTTQETDRVGTELLDSQLVDMQTGGRGTGPLVTLTHEGRKLAEDYLYNKTWTAKRRSLQRWLMSLIRDRISSLIAGRSPR